MAKKRLIFTLLYNDGHFMLSRNFRLQKIGDVNWLENNYGFSKVGFSLDELVVLDVTRGKRNPLIFCEALKALTKDCFAPIAAGGGVVDVHSARQLLRSGADKVVLNTVLHTDQSAVFAISQEFGQQCIVAAIDCKWVNDDFLVVINNGTTVLNLSLMELLSRCKKLPIGEIYLNSIDRDGTGNGLQFEMLNSIPESFNIPVIIAGGIGNSSHIYQGLIDPRIDAVATANLLNFIGNGIRSARTNLIELGVALPEFSI